MYIIHIYSDLKNLESSTPDKLTTFVYTDWMPSWWNYYLFVAESLVNRLFIWISHTQKNRLTRAKRFVIFYSQIIHLVFMWTDIRQVLYFTLCVYIVGITIRFFHYNFGLFCTWKSQSINYSTFFSSADRIITTKLSKK